MTEVIQNANSSFITVCEESHTRFARDISLSLNMTNPTVIQRAKPDESLVNLVRDISLSLNMTKYFSHSVLDTESVNADYSYIKLKNPSLIVLDCFKIIDFSQ